MSIHSSFKPPKDSSQLAGASAFLTGYLDSLSLVERLAILDINAVQALLLFNIADNEVTAGELKTRGYYQGSNVSYNLKKLVENGYMHHSRCEIDRRSVRVSLTPRGHEVRTVVAELFSRHAEGLVAKGVIEADDLDRINGVLRRMERYWTDQIRYIY